MYTFKIGINFRFEKDKINNIFNYLLNSLRLNGQIVGKEWPVFFKNNTLHSIVICPEKTSLEPKNRNKYVQQHWHELEKKTQSKLTIDLLGPDPTFHSINCKNKRDFYILYTDYLTIGSPIRCGECFGQIPLYKLPHTYQGEYYDILLWEAEYKACDQLQMSCRVGEKFGLRQMRDFNSQLSKEGLKICEKIKSLTEKPVYYYLFNYQKISLVKDKQRKCPSCGGKWLLKKPLHEKFDFQCHECHLLSNLSYNS